MGGAGNGGEVVVTARCRASRGRWREAGWQKKRRVRVPGWVGGGRVEVVRGESLSPHRGPGTDDWRLLRGEGDRGWRQWKATERARPARVPSLACSSALRSARQSLPSRDNLTTQAQLPLRSSFRMVPLQYAYGCHALAPTDADESAGTKGAWTTSVADLRLCRSALRWVRGPGHPVWLEPLQRRQNKVPRTRRGSCLAAAAAAAAACSPAAGAPAPPAIRPCLPYRVVDVGRLSLPIRSEAVPATHISTQSHRHPIPRGHSRAIILCSGTPSATPSFRSSCIRPSPPCLAATIPA